MAHEQEARGFSRGRLYYVSVLSSHTATLANLVAQVSAMQQAVATVVTELATVRAELTPGPTGPDGAPSRRE